MICAGGVEGEDSCQGDSGGPLTYKSGTQHVLIGDVSYGDGCAQAGKYGVYGRISFFREWIEGKMSSPTYCGSGPDADASTSTTEGPTASPEQKVEAAIAAIE